jgi:ACS family glucarate transporter-like MFS transporter
MARASDTNNSGNRRIMRFALLKLIRPTATAVMIVSLPAISFGMMGPIVTGYVMQLTGSFNGTFVLAGVLALIGAAATLTLTRQPVETQALMIHRAQVTA